MAVPATVVVASTGIVAATGRGGELRALRLARLWARICLRAAGGALRVEGLEHVDHSSRYVVMTNHQSALDIPAILAALPADLRLTVWAKRSLFRVPFLGWFMTRVGFVGVDRANRASAAGMFSLTLGLVAKGRTVLVFPEETYGPGDTLLPFQRGAFLIALKSRLPVLPVGIHGTRQALPPHSRLVHPGPVVVRIGRPIPTQDLAVAERDRLMEHTRAEITRLAGLAEPE